MCPFFKESKDFNELSLELGTVTRCLFELNGPLTSALPPLARQVA